ncbi:hypothetical protein D3C72_1792440 [compost metagenome]
MFYQQVHCDKDDSSSHSRPHNLEVYRKHGLQKERRKPNVPPDREQIELPTAFVPLTVQTCIAEPTGISVGSFVPSTRPLFVIQLFDKLGHHLNYQSVFRLPAYRFCFLIE